MSEFVVIGVTPTCPYGLGACAVGAREALQRIDGVALVSSQPDRYNCTFEAVTKDGRLPDVARWKEQMAAVVGEAFIFRGVEISVSGSVAVRGEQLDVSVESVEQPIRLSPFENKLQWNFRKSAPRQPEPAERDAYEQLKQAAIAAPSARFEIIGPIHTEGDVPILEVREFFQSRDQ